MSSNTQSIKTHSAKVKPQMLDCTNSQVFLPNFSTTYICGVSLICEELSVLMLIGHIFTVVSFTTSTISLAATGHSQ